MIRVQPEMIPFSSFCCSQRRRRKVEAIIWRCSSRLDNAWNKKTRNVNSILYRNSNTTSSCRSNRQIKMKKWRFLKKIKSNKRQSHPVKARRTKMNKNNRFTFNSCKASYRMRLRESQDSRSTTRAIVASWRRSRSRGQPLGFKRTNRHL